MWPLTRPSRERRRLVCLRRQGWSAWAFAMPGEGTEMSARERLEHFREQLEPYRIPTEVGFSSEFPRTETGKPQKHRLRQAALRMLEGGDG